MFCIFKTNILLVLLTVGLFAQNKVNTVPRATVREGTIQFFIDNSRGYGSIELKVGRPGALSKFNLSMKEMDFSLSFDYLIRKDRPSSVFQLDHKKKTFIEYRFPKLKTSDPQIEDVTIKELGSSEILGYPVKGYKVRENQQNTEVWLCEKIETFAFMADFQKAVEKYGMQNSALQLLQDKKIVGFPLKVIHTYQGEVTTMEATKIEPRKHPDALFNLPTDYTRVPESDDVITKLRNSPELGELENMMKQEMTPEQIQSLKNMLKEGLTGQ